MKLELHITDSGEEILVRRLTMRAGGVAPEPVQPPAPALDDADIPF